MSRVRRSRRGQGLSEYALVVGLVAVMCVAILSRVGLQVAEIFSTTAMAIGGTVSATSSAEETGEEDDDFSAPPLF
ncbi:MAG: hypothetical protein COV10_02585 [Candidatus Vogelbacteria bacterium CG10_big_fil_rev_8_21_14_0_10_51_16]|uniref:Flp family type IVb pilin n=1 Tax=Candidatus Vogelbacteria bacterium CG10_big_fil_rev_8_21_14_0_10_51_16 TaxID=1975045 RepID=A0A2H0RE50_9BACT|nr:MAG: hypothetical protein COV10_02585 [Candidatus Vogelbacteria bacterium CG10_big_fil_rev_8_21_14_0_10_51_16]